MSSALTTFLALKNLDPSFLKTFLISVLSSSSTFHRFVQSSTSASTSFSVSSTSSSSFWLAIITDPKIVRSCVSTTGLSSHVLERNVHYSVPNADMYLQAYVRDDVFLQRLSDLLGKIDSQYCVKIEIENEEKIKEKQKEKRIDIKKEDEKENENENEKWMKELKSWSML